MMLSLDTAYRSFGGEVEASSTPTICRLSDSRRHQLWTIARKQMPDEANECGLTTVVSAYNGVVPASNLVVWEGWYQSLRRGKRFDMPNSDRRYQLEVSM